MDNNELQLCEINELNTSQMDLSDSNIIFVIDSCILPDEGRLELIGSVLQLLIFEFIFNIKYLSD